MYTVHLLRRPAPRAKGKHNWLCTLQRERGRSGRSTHQPVALCLPGRFADPPIPRCVSGTMDLALPSRERPLALADILDILWPAILGHNVGDADTPVTLASARVLRDPPGNAALLTINVDSTVLDRDIKAEGESHFCLEPEASSIVNRDIPIRVDPLQLNGLHLGKRPKRFERVRPLRSNLVFAGSDRDALSPVQLGIPMSPEHREDLVREGAERLVEQRGVMLLDFAQDCLQLAVL